MQKAATTRKGQTQGRHAEGCQREVPGAGGEVMLSVTAPPGRGAAGVAETTGWLQPILLQTLGSSNLVLSLRVLSHQLVERISTSSVPTKMGLESLQSR